MAEGLSGTETFVYIMSTEEIIEIIHLISPIISQRRKKKVVIGFFERTEVGRNYNLHYLLSTLIILYNMICV